VTHIHQPEATLSSLDNFKVALLRFTLRAEEEIRLPEYAGSSLRGAFGTMFRRIACAPHCQNAKTCLLASQCAYARVFEARPNVEGYKSVSEGGLPRPFVIHPPLTKQPIAKAGESICFYMALIGFAAEYLPYFILTWRELGRVGIGGTRGRFRLEKVENCASLEGETRETVYSSTDELVHNRLGILTADSLLAMQNRSENSRLSIELLTPMRLKSGGEFLRAAPPFDVLMGVLLRRLESLSFFYCSGSLNLDYRGLMAQAKEVQALPSNVRWVEWDRYSHRQDRWIPLGGLLGRVEYKGDVTPFLPYLSLGELVGVGNNCAFGLGRFQITLL
jgi:CRISPR-associated endoribonuclease Cas6